MKQHHNTTLEESTKPKVANQLNTQAHKCSGRSKRCKHPEEEQDEKVAQKSCRLEWFVVQSKPEAEKLAGPGCRASHQLYTTHMVKLVVVGGGNAAAAASTRR